MQSAIKQPRVHIIDANLARAAELSHRLQFLNYSATSDTDPTAKDWMDDADVALVLGDMPSGSGLRSAAAILRRARPNLPVLRIDSVDGALALEGDGPIWTLDSPLKRSQIVRLLRRAERYRGRNRRQTITGTSRPIRAVRRSIEQVADFDTTVLVTGESGTGKELVARTIHELSERADKPFVPINCGAIPPELLESELFGHDKGAFTGAISARIGRFELAEGGTLFLDEIGDMSLPMQVKLLRVLQERTFERVGSNKIKKCDVRIIAATHRDLPAAVKSGDFREDLFYRLNVFPIEMPPLYKRASDLPQLLDELLLRHNADATTELRVSPSVVQVLARYDWPGNIRELSNLVERLAILKPNGVIEVTDLPEKYCKNQIESLDQTSVSIETLQQGTANLKSHIQAVERDLIVQAMDASNAVVAKAARMLKMRRTTLVEKLGKYGIQQR